MKFKWISFFIVIAIVLVGCKSQETKPVEIKQNVDTCETCNMGIQDLDSAAQIILEDGKPLLFDDIGCLIHYIQENEIKYEAAFVHDYQTKEWISFDESTFVQDHLIASPMSYGIAAFKTKEKATAFQSENGGTIFTKNEILKQDIKEFKTGGKEGHGH